MAAADTDTSIYMAESDNQVIRKLSPTGIITTVAGNGRKGFSGDNGPALSAMLNESAGIAPDGTEDCSLPILLSSKYGLAVNGKSATTAHSG
jgi:hypothetical protein